MKVDPESNVNDVIFQGPHQKILRAIRHQKELVEIVSDYYAGGLKLSPWPSAENMQTVSFSHKEIPAEFSSILGDIIHNLRSMLDLLVNDMSEMNGNRRNAFFPIAENFDSFPKRLKESKARQAGAEAVNIIRELAPYRDGSLELYAIHQLDISDKHRQLLPRFAPEFTIRDLKLTLGENGEHTLSPDENSRPSSINLHFPKGSPIEGREIIETVNMLVMGSIKIYLMFYERVYKKWYRIPPNYFDNKNGLVLIGEEGLLPK